MIFLRDLELLEIVEFNLLMGASMKIGSVCKVLVLAAEARGPGASADHALAVLVGENLLLPWVTDFCRQTLGHNATVQIIQEQPLDRRATKLRGGIERKVE
ncbi:MAG: hypothetical protein AAB726_00105 [Patescibacteria group bacterium]